MKVSDLDFQYPEELIATSPQRPSRVMWVKENGEPEEITLKGLMDKIPAGDILVVNNTQVLKRRVFAGDVEILFLKQINATDWEVLFPSKKYKLGEDLQLPLGVKMTLIQKGRPQTVRLSESVQEDYFQKVAELPLPPYIQKARNARHTVEADESWYQTAWAKTPGSFAAPTASLHFSHADMAALKEKGVDICEVTLHVGLGTFLPITADDLNDHDMHEEYVEISSETWQKILKAKSEGRNIWSLGTTSTRSLESAAGGLLSGSATEGFRGFTKLLIQPGYRFKIVNRLLTNFHQPQSTLLALVAAFSSLETVKACYLWAIERKFRLFSYGDLTCWTENTK
ncbi:tRNA preQ1(34) S-adenosylmethionine ribosyltransferase-isomerase QueA [Bdellovibrio svalbardensis]|uniref:tRNA preQ1(34) S-adenosylmethionine ribosyltransferase-isomerase QueA n=1 Tax=Bdellovibrio svalbardensis TaxID=2972972 RepID=A0ABT6DJD4_9BACT|nr:tRNA preQ1(34) S-adenosylmethionine ribosyltransferase-isomerase QueA [Bdellovibrio svalbardensis]MDG0816335.1 tRNA preQ1(34) S-adenosylmethionine ribosyltransferase-isomerase QueA [Bdellovibrio svalbardensis]